jgi:hypothetical protein
LLSPNWSPSEKELKQFAVISLVGFAALGLVAWRWTGAPWLAAALGSFGALVCGVGLAWPAGVRPVYVALLAVSLPVGWVVSGVLLRFVFYGVVTPVGLFFRVFGRDALMLRRQGAESYWLEHEPQGEAGDYFRQS